MMLQYIILFFCISTPLAVTVNPRAPGRPFPVGVSYYPDPNRQHLHWQSTWTTRVSAVNHLSFTRLQDVPTRTRPLTHFFSTLGFVQQYCHQYLLVVPDPGRLLSNWPAMQRPTLSSQTVQVVGRELSVQRSELTMQCTNRDKPDPDSEGIAALAFGRREQSQR
jgi:hypothetical protein